MEGFLLGNLGAHPVATLSDLRQALICHFGDSKPVVTPQAIAQKLDARCVTLKVSKPVPFTENSVERQAFPVLSDCGRAQAAVRQADFHR